MRVESQVRVPVEQAQLISAGAFRFDTSQAQAIGQIGSIVGELSKRKQGMEDRIAVSNTNAAMKKAQLDYQTEIIGKPLDQHAAILQKHINFAKSSSLSQKMSKDARTIADNSLNTWGQGFTDTGELATINSLHKEDRIRVTSDLEEALVEGDGVEIQAAEEAFDEHFATDPEAGEGVKDNIEARASAQLKKDAINNIKPDLVATINSIGINNEGKQAAIEAVNAHTQDLQKSGVLTEAEAADANKSLGNWAIDWVEGRQKRTKDAIKKNTAEIYTDFIPSISTGDLTYNDIDDSKLLKADKEKWKSYLKGSYKDAPTKTTAEGQTALLASVWDSMTLQLSPKEAEDVLMEVRYTDSAITDKDLEWAIDKVNNPYKRDTIENLRFAIKTNTSQVRKGFNTKAEEQRLVNSNVALIQWVDDQLEAGKTPTRKEMNAMASQFRVVNGTLVDIGQTVERGGAQWEVVGFDGNGEPLVEEID